MKMLFTWFLYTHTLFILSWHSFMDTFMSLIDFEYQFLCMWYDSWKTYVWFHVFEGSLTSFSKINLTSYLFFKLVVYKIYTWSYFCFNWYHWIVSIGIDLILFLYILIFCFPIYVCINFNWYTHFSYIYDLFCAWLKIDSHV